MIDLLKAKSLHVGSDFFATDAAGTKHHYRLLFDFIGNRCGSLWELAEILDIEIDGVFESPQFDFVVVASIEQGDRSLFIEPLLKHFRRNLGRRVRNGLNPFGTDWNDFAFDSDQHAIEGLVVGEAFFDRDIDQLGHASNACQEKIDRFACSGQEQIDPFAADQDGTSQGQLFAKTF